MRIFAFFSVFAQFIFSKASDCPIAMCSLSKSAHIVSMRVTVSLSFLLRTSDHRHSSYASAHASELQTEVHRARDKPRASGVMTEGSRQATSAMVRSAALR